MWIAAVQAAAKCSGMPVASVARPSVPPPSLSLIESHLQSLRPPAAGAASARLAEAGQAALAACEACVAAGGAVDEGLRGQAQALAELLFEQWHAEALAALGRRGWLAGGRDDVAPVVWALHAADLVQRLAVCRYAGVPAGLWQQVHALFAQVLARGWQDKRGRADTLTPALCYARLSLLGLTASGSLEPAKLATLFAWVDAQASAVALAEEGAAWSGGFAANLAADAPPRFYEAAEALPAQVVRLELSAVLAAVCARLNASGDVLPVAELQLLLRLRSEWGGLARRRHLRYQRLQRQSLTVLPGFAAGWHQLGGDELAAGFEPEAAAVPLRWRIVDLSLSGLQLEGGDAGVEAGSVLLLGKPGGRLRCALVRRVRRQAGGTVLYGVEYLGKRAAAGLLRVEHSLGNQEAWQAAITLHGDGLFGGGNMLLAEGRPFQAMRTFSLADGAGRKTIQATRLRSQTTRYQLFDYKIVAIEA